MSKYHPLDVRHPANRENERRSYLLPAAPPARPVAESRREAARSSPARSSPARAAGPDRASPWDKPARGTAGTNGAPARTPPAREPSPAAPVAAERTGSGFAGFLRSLVFLLIFVALVATQTDLLDPVLTEIRYRALELGIRLPFRAGQAAAPGQASPCQASPVRPPRPALPQRQATRGRTAGLPPLFARQISSGG